MTTKTKAPKRAKGPSRPDKLTGARGRKSADSTEIPGGVRKLLEELLPHFANCIPETTACHLIGLDWEVWDGYCARYPALRLAAKRAAAERLVAWQRRVEEGGPGWQSAATLLERRDGANWERGRATASRPRTSPLARAVKGRGKS